MGTVDLVRRSGLPVPVAGRSRMPSWHPLSACPLRFGILPSLAPRARLPGTGSPERRRFVVEWPQVFNLRESRSGVVPVQVENLHPRVWRNTAAGTATCYGSIVGSTGWKGRTQMERNCTGLPWS